MAGRADQVIAMNAIIEARAARDSAQQDLDLATRAAVKLGATKAEVAELAGVHRNTL